MTDDLQVLSNHVVANVEELELLGKDVDCDGGRSAKSPTTLVEVEDRVETRTIAIEEILVALTVVEAGDTQQPHNETQNIVLIVILTTTTNCSLDPAS